MIDEALTEEEKVEQRLGKPIYDIMKCYDGVTRAVPLVNGVKIDPSLSKKGDLSEKENAEKKSRPKISIQDRLQNKVEDFISAIEGQVDDNEIILNNNVEIGKVLINKEYPFALIKYLDKNFNKDQIFKSKNGSFKIFIPEWLKI